MITIPDFTAPTKHRNHTLIPLVLTLAIAIAGLVEPQEGAGDYVADTLSHFPPPTIAGVQSPQRNTK